MNLAPNGKKSNLTPEQYKLVRTPQFKKWFGDWENSPETASKVVDENGEPLVVYHGTSQKFNEFYFKNLHYINGFYFTPSEDIAQDFAEASINPFLVKKTYPIIKECFLNIKNIADYDVTNFKKTRNDKSYNKFVHEFIDKNKIDGVVVNKDNAVKGGIKLSQKYLNMQELIEKGTEKEQYKVLNREFEHEQYIVFEPNQIKLADGTNTTFDGSNTDIRYADGGSIDKNCIDYIKKTESILKNGYYHCFGSLCFITYNSGNQKDLNVYQTVNLLLSKSLSELLKIDEESASNLISNYYDNARRFDTLNIIKELKGCNIIIADRHKIVCANNIDNVATRYKKVGNMETEWQVIFESKSGSGSVTKVRVSASSFNDAKKKGWIKSGLNKKYNAFLTAHEIKALGGLMALQIASTGYTLHNNVKSFKYTIGGL